MFHLIIRNQKLFKYTEKIWCTPFGLGAFPYSIENSTLNLHLHFAEDMMSHTILGLILDNAVYFS